MDEKVLNEAMECYNEEENRKVTIAAAEVEYENYCKHKRPCTGSQSGGSVI